MMQQSRYRSYRPIRQYIGLDIAKNKIDCHIINGTHHHRFIITNNPQGYDEFLSQLQSRNFKLQHIHVCCEATGSYYLGIATFLAEHHIRISVVNPRAISAYAKERLLRVKTDRQDAKLIAEYCQQYRPQLWQKEPEYRQKFKSIQRRISQLNQILVSEKNRLPVSDEFAIPYISKMIIHIEQQLEQCREELTQLIQENEILAQRMAILKSIPGVGNETAAILLYLLYEPQKFPTAKQLISFVGLSPIIKDSGKKQGIRRISRMGDKYIRKALYMPARAACTVSKLWRPWYEQKLKEGKHPKEIYILMMCKILKYAHTCLKNNTPFNPDLHRKWQDKQKTS